MTQTIQQQIEETEKKLLELKRKAKESESEWLAVPELGKEFEIKVHDKGKSWNELELSEREEDLPTAKDCLFLMSKEGEKYAKILKMDGSSLEDDFFIKQYSELSRKNGLVARFYSYSVYSGLYSWGGASVSHSFLGVRFCRPIKKDGKKK